ncbi:zinc finger (C3HC4-type RING finger) family protein [Raphanus sativus]|nr:zinc finger (C3HC4-type RING finger) family protein [Raphanus sativus]
MEFLGRDSDSDYAFQLQMEEAIAASLSSRSRAPYRPPSPPVVARCGFAIVEEEEAIGSTPRGGSENVRRGGEGNSRGKGKAHDTTTTGDRNPNSKVGSFQNASANVSKRPSPAVTVRPAQSAGEGSSKVGAAKGSFRGDLMYRLYSKGLVNEASGSGKGKVSDVVAGFGVAICDQRDALLFESKGQLVGRGANRQGAEIQALTRGLTEASKLGIKHVAIFCDSFPIFQYVRGSWTPKQKKIAMLIDDLQRIRQQFSFSQAVLVPGNEVKYAYKLARESIVSQATPLESPRQAKVARKEECLICFNDIDPERMFSIGKCSHRFCFQCVKQHVEVKLLHGMIPNCPHDKCKSEMVIDACGKLLTPKLGEMWKQRIKENAIPVTERVYCPYLRCSALMSKTKISESAKTLLSAYPASGVRRCVECRGLFCVDCKVPWHGKLSCAEYKKLHPNPPADDVKLKSLANNKMWRQCGKCQHMIELSQGCNHITCRCGHEFCYNCGGGWNKKTGTCVKRCPIWDEAYIMRQNPARVYVAPNNYFDEAYIRRQDPARVYVAPNNYFDDHDEEDDEDYETDEDFDYDYGDFPFNLGHHMNDVNPDEPFDPFFDLPDGVVFLPHMLSPRSRQQLYDSDDDSDEETGQPPHLRQSNAPSGNETTRVSAPPEEEEEEEEVDDYPFNLDHHNKGEIFLPHMLSPRSREQLYDSDDDSDEETGQPAHLRQSNVPSGNEATRVNAHFTQSNDRSEDGTVYDSDGYEIEDYTNPYDSDDY